MSIFSMEDPLTPEYIESSGFHTIHDKNNPTILYRMRLYRHSWWTADDNAELRFYFKAAKKSKEEFCELSYRVSRVIHKATIMRHKLSYPKTQQDLDLLIVEAKTLYAKARGVNINDIIVSKNEKF